MHNAAFWRALHSLAHPLTVSAVVVLLVNDHLLRHRWPSWWTGKLGDFAWLVFAPLVCALVVAWVLPHPPIPSPKCERGRKTSSLNAHERQVGIIAFAFIGVWFALAKTVPLVHALTTGALEAIVGWEGTLRLDATDLLTLPALLIGWHIWTRADNTPPTLSPRVWPILALGIMATLASDEPYFSHIGRSATCIFQEESQLVIYGSTSGAYEYKNSVDGNEEWELKTETEIFRSRDGGMSWLSESYENYNYREEIPKCTQESNVLVDPTNELIQYRWIPADRIERSSDGGITWVREYDLVELRQDVRHYYNRSRFYWADNTIIADYQSGPFSGLIDSKTGNVVLAMGLDGVLVRTPDAEWVWVRVGPYFLANLERFDHISAILFFEFWLAGALSLLVLTTSAAYIRHAGRFRQLLLGIGWLSWFILTAIFLPFWHLDSNFAIGVISLPLLVFLAIPLGIAALFDFMKNDMRLLSYVLLVGITNALLFLFPFVLWTQGAIPPYRTALTFSLMLTLGSLAASYVYLKRILPRVPIPQVQQLTTNDQPPSTES
jgi:hypothetical protein